MLFSALIVHEYVEWSDPTSPCLLVQSCSQVSHMPQHTCYQTYHFIWLFLYAVNFVIASTSGKHIHVIYTP